MTDFLEHVQHMINRQVDWTDEEREMIETAAAEVIDLQIQALAGDDVEEELQVVRATIANIAAGKAVKGANLLQDALRTFLMKGVLRLLA